MRGLTVLVVEDEILIAETIKIYLEERGHQVIHIAISYDEALQKYHLRRPEIVLLDIRLYGLKSGIDFANFLQENKDNVPFIYLTSQYDQRILEQALKTNPYGYLTKPIQKESLWTSIESAYNLFLSKNTDTNIVTIQDGKNNYHIKVNEILYVQADHVYCKIVTIEKKELIIRKTLQQVLELLVFDFMIYCHRSYIVNLHHISEWNNNEILLKNKLSIPISRSRKDEILLKLRSFMP